MSVVIPCSYAWLKPMSIATSLRTARERYSQWLLKFPDHAQRTEVLIRHGLISRAQEDDAQAIEDFAEVLRQSQ